MTVSVASRAAGRLAACLALLGLVLPQLLSPDLVLAALDRAR